MVHSGRCSELLATLGDLTSKQQSSTRVNYNTIRCGVACLSPVLLWPERVCGSCSVCVKAASWCACGAGDSSGPPSQSAVDK